MDPIFKAVTNLLLAVFGIIFLVLAIRLALNSQKAQYAETARTSFNAVIAMVFVAVAFGAVSFAKFGTQILAAVGI